MAPQPPSISYKVLIPLCLVMLVFAILPLAVEYGPIPREQIMEMRRQEKSAPFLTGFRDGPEGNTAFNNRLERAPIMYGLGHILPAIIWSVGIPIQHSAYIRRHYISLHRFSGWAVFSSVLVLTCTGLLFSPFKLAYTHPDALHLHRPFPDIKALAWIVWPTFEASLWIIGPIQIATAVMTVQAAREKKIARHRTLANLHTVSGLVIHIQRVNLVVTKAIAAVLLALNQDQRDGLGVPKDARDFWKGEMAGFALTAWAALFMVIPWAYSLTNKGTKPKPVTNGRAQSNGLKTQ